ncbi:MAG: hypothetical protein M0P66_07010 [Salinivirgaceae bacterium]|nr:hypothetical protein [Salinivirgaceae bacterium]
MKTIAPDMKTVTKNRKTIASDMKTVTKNMKTIASGMKMVTKNRKSGLKNHIKALKVSKPKEWYTGSADTYDFF